MRALSAMEALEDGLPGDTPDADLGLEALRHRWDRGHFGWRQDDIFMAYLGLAGDARDGIVQRARRKHGASRFPVFWGPNYDWVPDQDHGGVLLKALQAMILQAEGKQIFLAPAWPKDWNVKFNTDFAEIFIAVQTRIKLHDPAPVE
mgnify:CR=1 FL=1